VALGANLGDAAATLRWALAAISTLPGCALTAQSALYRHGSGGLIQAPTTSTQWLS
jgi:2-amino-4-hydroxy-6-hydroxymethyldihydropteridine diphosphokinase